MRLGEEKVLASWSDEAVIVVTWPRRAEATSPPTSSTRAEIGRVAEVLTALTYTSVPSRLVLATTSRAGTLGPSLALPGE